MTNADEPTHPRGENVTDAQTVRQDVLFAVVESHFDSVSDQLHRAITESEDYGEMVARVDRAAAELELFRDLLVEELEDRADG
jgi:hypothetical protein